jgi:hypothetical protein
MPPRSHGVKKAKRPRSTQPWSPGRSFFLWSCLESARCGWSPVFIGSVLFACVFGGTSIYIGMGVLVVIACVVALIAARRFLKRS